MVLALHPLPDLAALARRQSQLDREATARLPFLYEAKQKKLLASPHGFLRGSAPLFYEVLAALPELGEGPDAEGIIVGDMHLENVGAFPTDDNVVVLDLNDFDDATTAPLRFDVLRVLTSTLLVGASLGLPGKDQVAGARSLFAAYAAVMDRGGAGVPSLVMPAPFEGLMSRASRRTKRDLFDRRAPKQNGVRRFERGSRYFDLPSDVAKHVQILWDAYVAALGPRAPKGAGKLKVVDAALRVAGTGSLGRLRISLLVADDHGEEFMYELKEQRRSAVDSVAAADGSEDDAARSARAARTLIAAPPRRLTNVTSPELGVSFVGRKLSPEEDKLDLTADTMRKGFQEVVSYVGFLLARAHRRALARPPSGAVEPFAEPLIERATSLATLFHGIYLAYARI